MTITANQNKTFFFLKKKTLAVVCSSCSISLFRSARYCCVCNTYSSISCDSRNSFTKFGSTSRKSSLSMSQKVMLLRLRCSTSTSSSRITASMLTAAEERFGKKITHSVFQKSSINAKFTTTTIINILCLLCSADCMSALLPLLNRSEGEIV